MSGYAFEFISSSFMKSEPADQQENDHDTDEANKCGEVVARYGGSLILICGFCHDTHESMITFGLHINQKHEDQMKRINSFLNPERSEYPVKFEDSAIDEVLGVKTKSESANIEKESIQQTIQSAPLQPVKYMCEYCGQSYKHKGRLRNHQIKNICKKIPCKSDDTPTCSTLHPEELDLNRRPQRQLRNSRKRSQFLETDHVKSEDTQFECDVADREESMEFFEECDDAKEEAISEHEKPPDDNPLSDKFQHKVGNALEVLASETLSAKRYPCGICERSFKSRQACTYHIGRFHEDQLPVGDSKSSQYLRCRYCNVEFSTKPECTEHEGTHIGEKRFICWYCPHTFRTNYGRKRHMRVHTGERPFKCTECPKAFPHMVQLDYHIRKHKNLREFSCETCGKAFFRKFELSLHERKHTGFRPLVCEDCGKTFNVMSELNEHRKRHTDKKDWKCETCGKCFYSKWTLKDHMAGHSSETPFECDVCGRKFSRAKALKKHKKLHSDVKAYICNICGKAYAQDSGLYAHKKTHGRQSVAIDISHVNIAT